MSSADNHAFITRTATNTHLLEGLQDPNNDAVWKQFVNRYRPLIVRYARRSFGFSADDADDAAQVALAAFVEAYQKGQYDRDKGQLRKWLFGIATTRLRNLLRRRARLREVQVVDKSTGTGLILSIPDDCQLEETWEEEWRRAVYRQCMEEIRFQFDAKTVEAFELYVHNGRSADLVAETLEMTPNAVYLAKHRILKRIREISPRMEGIW